MRDPRGECRTRKLLAWSHVRLGSDLAFVTLPRTRPGAFDTFVFVAARSTFVFVLRSTFVFVPAWEVVLVRVL